MSGFSADWLELRAGADARARDAGLVARLAGRLGGSPLRILDLGAGTGASLRALAPAIASPQTWVLADGDGSLLARAEPVAAAALERREVDLGQGLEALFEPAPHLVTASAFLDLCGAEWIDRLARCVAACRAALYVALSYDGRERWEPDHPLDGPVLAAFHADQRRDKGLGPALGPDAHARLRDRLLGLGYRVEEAASDWRLSRAGDAALIGALAEGTAAAVSPRIGAGEAQAWRAARTGASRVLVGHRDLLALPPG